MNFQNHNGIIQWKLHLRSPPTTVFKLLTTDEGREKFWVEKSELQDNIITLVFPNNYEWKGKILEINPPSKFSLEYLGSVVTFHLTKTENGGTDLQLEDRGVDEEYRCEVTAGWGSVLMSLKAAADFGVDLRNHDPTRTWDQGYFEN